MNGLRYTDIAHRDNEFMDLTSLTQDEFAELLPSFEEAFQKRMKEYRIDGHPQRTRLCNLYQLSPIHTRRSLVVYLGLLENECAANGTWADVWAAAKQSQPMDPYLIASVAINAAANRRCARTNN